MIRVGRDHDRDYLITAVLQPSAALAPGYGMVSLITKSGEQVEGSFQRETGEVVEIKDAGDVLRRILKRDITDRQNRSPMSDGLYKQLSLEEFTDLIAFLESLSGENLDQVKR